MAREHIRAFRDQPGVTIVGLHSRTATKAEALAEEFGIPVVADHIDRLAATGADLVVVTVPELAANAVAKACFKHPWTVLLEKPAGYNLADAEDIASSAQGRAAETYVAFNRRQYGSVLRARENVDGDPSSHRFVHVQDQQSYAEARAYNHPEEVAAHFMYANSIHNIDLIRVFCRGEIEDVSLIMPWKGEASEVVLVHLSFSSGDTALYEGIWKGPGPWACSVSTPKVRWNLMPVEEATLQLAGERKKTPFARTDLDNAYKPGFFLQAEAVLKAMRKEPSAAVSLAESLSTMRMINRMFGT